MIRQLAMVLLAAVLGAGLPSRALAEKYQLLNGSTLEGEPISFDTRGVVLKLSNGEFAPREAWTNFTQAALKQLAANPKAKPFLEPFLEEDDEPEPLKRAAVELKLKPVPRLDRPNPKTNSLFASPISVLAFLLLYLANLYAGLEIARYRRQPPGLVCGVAAVAPVIGPIVFLSLPARLMFAPEEPAYTPGHEAPPPSEAAATPADSSAAATPDQAGQAAPPEVAAAPPPPTIYRRPHTTFNRRFFETKLAGFLRVVPSDAEKDLVVCISSTRGNYVGQRIIRIMPSELMLLVKKGDASSDVLIPFNEIFEVQVRHRDYRAEPH
jgi:hypothetical protein